MKLRITFLCGVFSISAANLLFAQAWASPAGTGSISVAGQRIDQTGHRLTDGTLMKNGASVNSSVYLEGEYAVTDRFSVAAGLPFVFSRYTDAAPPPPFIPFFPIDECRCWHSGWQDLNISARYNIFNGVFGLSSAVSAGVPSHDYEFRGEAVLGRRLKELRIAVNAGVRLERVSPRLFVEGDYSYAFVERVLDIPNNRANATIAVGYAVTRKLTARTLLAHQHTYGGLRLGAPPPFSLNPPGDVNTPERLDQHDRMLRDNSVHIGGAVSYRFSRFDLFGSYIAFISGTDTHAGRASTLGISWPLGD